MRVRRRLRVRVEGQGLTSGLESGLGFGSGLGVGLGLGLKDLARVLDLAATHGFELIGVLQLRRKLRAAAAAAVERGELGHLVRVRVR